jgi:hypothetical protein
MNKIKLGVFASRLCLLLMLSLQSGIALAQNSLPPENCTNGLDDDADGYVDCYDVDCQCFDSTECSIPIPTLTSISMQIDWKSDTFYSPGFSGGIAIVGNMNPQTDNIPEILAIQNNNSPEGWDVRFFRGDGTNGATADTLNVVTGVGAWNEPLIGDVDGDGIPEMIMTEWDSYLRVYRNFTPGANPVMSHWITSSNKTQGSGSRAMLADMDENGTPEIVIDNEIFIFDFSDPANPKLRKVLDAGTTNPSGRLSSNSIASAAVADLLSPADCNGDPDCAGLELAAGPVIYSIDLDTLDGDGFQIKIQRDLNFMELPDAFSDGYTAVADMNIDGIPDIVVMGRAKVGLDPVQLGVYVWNKNGLLRFMTLANQNANGLIYSLPMIANVFDDTKRGLAKDFPEIVFASSSNMYCYNLHATNFPDIAAWWFLPVGGPFSGDGWDGSASAFDFNGDGISEIVYCDNQNLRIIYGGHLPFPAGVDANRNWAATPFFQHATGFRYPVVADSDDDGQAEIIIFGSLGAPSTIGQLPLLYVFGSADGPWPPCRNLWNQFNYNIVNVDDDLGIPVQQQQHWKEFPAPGSGKRPLNMALGQRGPLNGPPMLPLADLGSTVDTFYCDLDSLRLRLLVCNNGSVSAPAGLSLQWYLADPTVQNVAALGAPHVFPSVVAKDSCAFWNLAIPLPPSGALYGIINDNGSLSGPIDLANDFPSTNLLECNYLDNLFDIQVSYTSPTLDLGPDQLICKEAQTLLSASPGFSRYQWQDGSQNATFSAPGIGTYWVDAWDICGNLFSDTLQLLAIPTPPLSLGSTAMVCAGNSITLTTTGFDQVDWTSAGATVCAGCPSYTLSPAADLSIQVIAQSGICVEHDTISISLLPLPQINGQAVETHCGLADGAINVLINSSLPYQLEWSNGQTTANLAALTANTYTLTVTDAVGCSQSQSYSVAGSTALILNPAVLTDVFCFGAQTGEISVSLSSGTPPYQFNWSTGPGSDLLSPLSAGNYALTVIDQLGCTSTSVYQLTEPPLLSIQSTVQGTSCTSSTADISLTGQGGTSPYSFQWDSGQNTPVLNQIGPGTYAVTLSDANGCQTTQSFDIQTGGSPEINSSIIEPVLCFGENTGSISVNATLGTAPYLFNWSTGGGADVLTNLAAGNYGLTVTDVNGCSTSNQYTVTEPASLQLLSSIDSTNCTSTTADISLTGQGGTSPYSFHWDGGQNTPVLNQIGPGTYAVTLSDANGCQTTQSFDIQTGGSPEISSSIIEPVHCFGENTGSISVNATLGTAPYLFNWSIGGGTDVLTNLAAGNYGLTVTDANGCSVTSQFSLTQPEVLSLFADIDSTSCTSSTGNISVTVQGGTAPFAYSWNSGQNTSTVNNLNPGTYALTISDEHGCTLEQSFTLAPGGAPVVDNSQVIPVACSGGNNGQITVGVIGGVPPYQFLWSTGAMSNLVDNLPAGNYSFTATGDNGCVTTVQFSISEPPPLELFATVDSTSCSSNTGNINLAPQGGTSPYTYLWNNGQTTSALINLSPGNYSLTATDSNACTSTADFVILPGGTPELAGSVVTPVTCFGESNGEISVQITGGVSPYQYHWSFGQGDTVLHHLAAGTYQLTISDANACTSLAEFTLGTPAALEATLNVVADTCGQATGSITVNTSGGISPYTFLWSDGQSTQDRMGISAGNFLLTVTDANTCTFTQTVEVLSIDIIPQFMVAGDTITCAKSSVELSPNPAPASWDFQWQAPDGTLLSGAHPTVIAPGQYQVTGTNAFGCSGVQLVDIAIDTLKPEALVAADDLFIPCDESLAILDGSASSSGANIMAQWFLESNGQIVWDTLARVANASEEGVYVLSITNLKNGCVDKDSVQVSVAQKITGAMLVLDSISCFGLEDGVIRVDSVIGGLAPYLYALDNQALGSDFMFSDLHAGVYRLSIQDANACSWESGDLLLGAPAPLTLHLTASDTRIDQGESVVLQAQVLPVGAVLSQIQWSPAAYFTAPASLTETVRPEETTLFQIELEDNNGCLASDTVRVLVRREAIYVPNVFHPGSVDNGHFTVFAGADIREVQFLRVYDRWGEYLFEARHFLPNDPDQGWDGNYRGKPVGPGVYIYYTVVELVDGSLVELKGNVTVLR